MAELGILDGKKILIVDDEPDVLESVVELLDMCDTETASNFETAEKLLNQNDYDVAILDIMGVKGFDLLSIANEKKLPTIMFTAHAMSPQAFAKSLDGGAKAYIPKDKMSDIPSYIADLLWALQEGIEHPNNWFLRLKSFFNEQFGSGTISMVKDLQKKYPWLDLD